MDNAPDGSRASAALDDRGRPCGDTKFEGVITHWQTSKNHGHVKFHDGHRMHTLFVHVNKLPAESNGALPLGQTITFRVVPGFVPGKFQADDIALTTALQDPGPNDIVKNLQARMKDKTIRRAGYPPEFASKIRVMTRSRGVLPDGGSATDRLPASDDSSTHPYRNLSNEPSAPQHHLPEYPGAAEYYSRVRHHPQDRTFASYPTYPLGNAPGGMHQQPSHGSYQYSPSSFEALVHDVEVLKHSFRMLADDLAWLRGFSAPDASDVRTADAATLIATGIGEMPTSFEGGGDMGPRAANLPIATRIQSLRSRLSE